MKMHRDDHLHFSHTIFYFIVRQYSRMYNVHADNFTTSVLGVFVSTELLRIS